ncbi:hypothetical protein GJ744_010725 [Endocarpon pusillum]|uniref:Programmed cell death protein 2 C-terminal domain-containing protein n=1 Tax=Endocarpon pusillum TaxID=364733 RepID=A0A8H7AHR4_9EURO|nr:hypothetical protein GJ744_010725 [Endocarpon pusillum]
MDSYDSDSSFEAENEYTETNVNLGYASREPTGDTISHLGGFSTWLDPNRTPPVSFARCKVCSSPMSLLLQLNGDLPQYFPNDERRLHIYSCRMKPCSQKVGSVRAIREVRKHKVEGATRSKAEKAILNAEPQKQSEDLGTTIFGATSSKSNPSNENPFSLASKPFSMSSNPFNSLPSQTTLAAKPPQRAQEPSIETFASRLRISSPSPQLKADVPGELWPQESAFPKPYPYLHLDAEYEALAPVKPQIPEASSSKIQTQYSEEDSTAPNGLDKDLFESNLDKTFLSFSDRLAQNPEQVLRYEWKGNPLLYSSTDAVGKQLVPSNGKTKTSIGMPRCDSCGAKRVFEMQLVPGAIAALEEDDINLEEGMEWGTILVGVCERNCGEIGEVVFKEEWCGVQWEERG